MDRDDFIKYITQMLGYASNELLELTYRFLLRRI